MNKIEKLIKLFKSCDKVTFTVTGCGEETFKTIEFKNAISALEKQLNSWIPVSERLPNEEECNKFDVTHPNARKFLCTIKVANYEPQVRTIYFSEIVGWKYSAQDYNEYVIAWQPLPPAYTEVKNDN